MSISNLRQNFENIDVHALIKKSLDKGGHADLSSEERIALLVGCIKLGEESVRRRCCINSHG